MFRRRHVTAGNSKAQRAPRGQRSKSATMLFAMPRRLCQRLLRGYEETTEEEEKKAGL